MSRSRPASLAVAAFLALAASAGAEARLDVSGSVVSAGEGSAEFALELRNLGDTTAAPVSVAGELLGRRCSASLEGGLKAGATRHLTLSCPLEAPPPGVHALTLLLEYTIERRGGVVQAMSQPAYLLLGVGEAGPPALRVGLEAGSLEASGHVVVTLESADGRPHRATLGAVPSRGIRAWAPEDAIAVPASGRASAVVPLFRLDAPWESVQGLVVTATTEDGALTRTAAAAGAIRVGRDPAWMPRLRRPLLAAAVVLLLAAGVAEARRRLAS